MAFVMFRILVSILCLSCSLGCVTGCVSAYQELPFPEAGAARLVSPESAQDIFRKSSALHGEPLPLSYRFLAKAVYEDRERTQKVKQVFVFAEEAKLRIENFTPIGNQLVAEIIIRDNEVFYHDVMSGDSESFSDVPTVLEHVLGVAFDVKELLEIFLARCDFQFSDIQIYERDAMLLVQDKNKQRACELDSKTFLLQRKYIGEDGLVQLFAEFENYAELEDGNLYPRSVRIFAPYTGKGGSFSLQYVSIGKPVNQALFRIPLE
jgi:hypothetical protein